MTNILFPYMARWHAVNWTRYHSLLSALAAKGHQIYVLQPPPLESEETNFQEIAPQAQKNVHIIDVHVNQLLWQHKFPFDKLIKKALFSFNALSMAKQLVTQHQIDVMLLYNIPQYFFSKIDVPVQVFDYADDYTDMLDKELGAFSNPLILNLARQMLGKMISRADITLTVSHELGKTVVGNVHVLANGVGASKSQLGDHAASLQVDNQDKPVVGFIGSFEYFIDFDIIIEAAAALPEVHFLLVGFGRDWQQVKNKMHARDLKNIQLTGGVPHEDVFRYISRMDICLNVFKPIPVSHRACPLKLFEYMSRKKPVISTRLQELKHIDEGFLYYADDAEELIAAVRQIFANPSEVQQKVAKAYSVTMDQYTWENLAVRFIELVQEKNVGAIA